MKRAVLGLIVFCAAYGQSPNPAIKFEVASVKAYPERTVPSNSRLGCDGGPGTSDPGRFTCMAVSVNDLVRRAFDLKPYQLPAIGSAILGSGGQLTIPAGIDIAAKIPAGATKEQFATMLQNLLIERFKLAYHWDKKDGDIYDLLVAKNGPKIKESPPDSAPSPETATPASGATPAKPKYGPNGCPVIAARHTPVRSIMGIGSRSCAGGTDASIGELVDFLVRNVGRPVTDATGLTGKYDISLAFARETPLARPEDDPPPTIAGGIEFGSGATIFTALQDQLGLRLEKKKGSVDVFVIDHVEKAPTED